MSLKFWSGQTPPSVEDALELVEEAKRAERERQEKAEAAAKAEARAVAELVRVTAPVVAGLERRLGLGLAADPGDRPAPLDVRRLARRYLRGTMGDNIPELLSAEILVANNDRLAALFLDLANEAARVLDTIVGFDADVMLDSDHELVVRTNAVEVAAWGSFMLRVHQVAGENGHLHAGVPVNPLRAQGRR